MEETLGSSPWQILGGWSNVRTEQLTHTVMVHFWKAENSNRQGQSLSGMPKLLGFVQQEREARANFQSWENSGKSS